MNANIPKSQLTALVIVSNKLVLDAPAFALSAHPTCTLSTPLAFQNPKVSQPAVAIPLMLPTAANAIIITASNFVFMFFNNKD
jgi:hypothetical protein